MGKGCERIFLGESDMKKYPTALECAFEQERYNVSLWTFRTIFLALYLTVTFGCAPT